MITILAALLAVSLSSSDLDEFFTLPSWLPDSVNKTSTPGSDPMNKKDSWYVEEYTNGYVRAGWKIYNINNPEEPILDFDQPTYNHGAWEQKRAPAWLDPPQEMFDTVQLYPFPIIADEDADRLQWHQLYFKDGVMFFSYEFVADRILNPTNLPSGKFKPKAHRLSTAIQSGVLSSFAGMLERQYYIMQAQTNGWEQGELWPDLDKKIFRFAPDETCSTNCTTNITWIAESNFGRFTEADIRLIDTPPLQPRWWIKPFGKQVADHLKLDYFDCRPEVLNVAGSENFINYSGQIRYTSVTNLLVTNFNFTATRTDYISTNVVYSDGDEFNYHPTNRTITTRRLNEYDNIKTLGDYILNTLSWYGMMIMSERWSTNVVITATTNYDTRVVTVTTNYYPVKTWIGGPGDENIIYWASKDKKTFDGDEIVPASLNDWVFNPTVGPAAQWGKCCQTFCSMIEDDVWHPYDYSYFHAAMPTVNLLNNVYNGVQQGTGVPSTYYALNCAPSVVPFTMKQVIETNFPHADGWAITNDTRRLLSDRLCCMNQAMSLMDRTYHMPKINYPTTCTNLSCESECYIFGEIPIFNMASQGSYISCDLDLGSAQWDDPKYTNIVAGLQETPCCIDRIVYRISPSGTMVELRTTIAGARSVESSEDMMKLAALCVKDITLDDGDYVIDLYVDDPYFYNSEAGMMINVNVYWQHLDQQGYTSVPYLIGSVTNTYATYRYVRSYTYSKPPSYPKLGNTQPGWQGWLISDSQFGGMISVHDQNTEIRPTTAVWFDEFKSHVRYRSHGTLYSSRNELENGFGDLCDSAKTWFVGRYGKDPENPRTVIPIVIDDAVRILTSSSATNGRITYGGASWTRADVTIDGDDVSVRNVRSYSETTHVYTEGYTIIGYPSLTFTWIHEEPEEPETEPLSMDAKVSIITRTDWEWKTLKRGDD